jgi:hypothetical protein
VACKYTQYSKRLTIYPSPFISQIWSSGHLSCICSALKFPSILKVRQIFQLLCHPISGSVLVHITGWPHTRTHLPWMDCSSGRAVGMLGKTGPAPRLRLLCPIPKAIPFEKLEKPPFLCCPKQFTVPILAKCERCTMHWLKPYQHQVRKNIGSNPSELAKIIHTGRAAL